MPVYAYKLVKQLDSAGPSAMERELNRLGADGWRVVSAFVGYADYRWFLLEREGKPDLPGGERL